MNDPYDQMASAMISFELIREEFPKFMDEVRKKVYQGALDYRDKSFDLMPSELIDELQHELYDICGWGWILSMRLSRIDRALQKLIDKYPDLLV